jgi:hypothetical protein
LAELSVRSRTYFMYLPRFLPKENHIARTFSWRTISMIGKPPSSAFSSCQTKKPTPIGSADSAGIWNRFLASVISDRIF